MNADIIMVDGVPYSAIDNLDRYADEVSALKNGMKGGWDLTVHWEDEEDNRVYWGATLNAVMTKAVRERIKRGNAS